jgi:hypothetical protein
MMLPGIRAKQAEGNDLLRSVLAAIVAQQKERSGTIEEQADISWILRGKGEL